MRPLMLDFQQGRRPGPLGWGLLIAGGLLALACLAGQWYLDSLTGQQQGDLHSTRRALTGDSDARLDASPAQTREQAQNLAEMRKVSQQLRRPWERLFATLESLPRSDIALLSLTPDARKGQLRLTAEARDLEAMLDFHRRLEASDELSDVSLLNHEIVVGVAEHPVLFNLSATWEIGDANP
ncbi:pilus assembly protein [Pseudomonas japonica]|uniref:pilus assembly protein n=1 Tax=Pseudomonas japonica TaxID=256466 RepID=UPI00382D8697